MSTCRKCNKEFRPQKGLKHYCSLACRNSRYFTAEAISKKSIAAKKSNKNPMKGKFGKNNPKWISRVKTKCLACGQEIEHTKARPRKYHAECWRKVSGGLREGSTKKHRCEYGGFLMDSGAEKAFAMKCDSLGIKWVKNKDKFFEYKDNKGKTRKYYPDFYLADYERWVEVKGKFYEKLDPFFNLKLKAVPNLVLIYSTEIREFNGLLV